MKFNRREYAAMPGIHAPLRAVLVALLVGLPLGGAAGETLISKSVSYFSIGGRTAEELDRALSASGPLMKSTGTRHPGATRIKFGGTITYVGREGRCAVGTARVTLSTRIILPRWKYRKQAGRDLALVWDTLASDIKRHEERHAEIARIHARQMEKALLALKPENDCERMQARVAEVSAEEVESHDKDQARFDRTEAANFDQRMIRLLQHRLEGLRKVSR
jgi:predicted secreted Zn-dependent protease